MTGGVAKLCWGTPGGGNILGGTTVLRVGTFSGGIILGGVAEAGVVNGGCILRGSSPP